MSKKNYMPLIFAVVIFLSAWAVYGGNQKSTPPKQTWEYKVIMIYRDGYTGSGKWEGMYEDGNLVGANFPPMVQKLKEVGELGWELTSTVSASTARHDGYEGYNSEGVLLKTTPSYAGYTTNIFYYFKRPK